MIYLLLLMYAHLHGQTNAFLYSRKGAESLPTVNEHIYLVAERTALFVAFLVGWLYGIMLHWVGLGIALVELSAGVLAFSYFHNAAYYLMRDRIDGTTYGSQHQSPTSTAELEFTYRERLVLFRISVVLLVVGYAVFIHLVF